MTEVIQLKELKKNFKGVTSVDLERLTVRKGKFMVSLDLMVREKPRQ